MKTRRRMAFSLVTAVTLLLIPLSAAQAVSLAVFNSSSPVAVEGQVAPNTGGQTFDRDGFDEPMTNAQGDVAFIATYGGASGAGVFLSEGGRLSSVAVSGQSTSAGTFANDGLSSFDGPQINDSGTVAFAARGWVGPGGLFQKTRWGSLTVLVQAGDAAPNGGSFMHFDDLAQNDHGDVAFIAQNDVGNWGVYLKPRWGPVQAIAVNGDTLPSTGNGTIDGSCYPDGPWINNVGDVAFQIDCISGGTGGFDGSYFLWSSGGGIQPLVMMGDPGPAGIGGTITDIKAGRPAMNDQEIVLLLSLSGASTENVVTTKALNAGPGAGYQVCAQSGQPAPLGWGTNETLSFNGDPTLAQDGSIGMAFTADPSNRDGIAKCVDGQVTLLALEGSTGQGIVRIPSRQPEYRYGSLEESSRSTNHQVFLDETGSRTGVYQTMEFPFGYVGQPASRGVFGH